MRRIAFTVLLCAMGAATAAALMTRRESPGQVAKHLNEIADLETMDRVMGHIASKVRKLSAEIRVTKDRLREAKQQVERLSWIPSAVQRFRRMQAAGKRHSANRDYLRSAERSVSGLPVAV